MSETQRNDGISASPVGERIILRRTFAGGPRRVLGVLIALNALSQVVYLLWLCSPRRWSHLASDAGSGQVPSLLAFAAVAIVEGIRAVQCASLWTFSLAARDPDWLAPAPHLRVAMLTTIVPEAEPIELVTPTLVAMRKVVYRAGTVDVWILDEADDPEVRAAAEALGVHHFSRKGRQEFKRRTGRFRSKTKAGNHNAWIAEHGDSYDVVAQLDPDHVPYRTFLEDTLGYFRDMDVAFVVAPQVYGDATAAFVARGAAAQAFVFHGV